jgi:hypothetical protein
MANNQQFYEKQLGFAYWYVTHKLLLKNILIAGLIVFDVCLIAFNLYILILNLGVNQKSYQQNLASLIMTNPNYAASRLSMLPQAIQVGQINSYANMDKNDIVAEIVNPNASWLATFDYQFKVGSGATESRRGFIFPGESKKIVALAVADGGAVSDLAILNVKWQKLLDFADVYKQKFNFDIKNIKYIPPGELGLGQAISVSRVTFDARNNTAYDFNNVNFVLLLNASGQIAAVNLANSGEFLSGKTMQLESTFFQRLPRITSVEILPEVNIFDPSVFLRS